MIKIENVSIENFRSVISETTFSLSDFNVIVGPNNSGKSNILRALNLFFNGLVENEPYDPYFDFPKYSRLGNRAQTKITVTIEFDPKKDNRIEKAIKELEDNSGQERLDENIIRLRLEYNRRGTSQWKFISKAGLRRIKADLVRPVVESLQSAVRFKYLPVGRNILMTIRNELRDELIKTIFSGWSGAVRARQEINNAISELIDRLTPRLTHSGTEITQSMSSVFTEIKKLEVKLPFNNLETMLPSLEPSIDDYYETGLNAKGAGVQTSSLLFFLKYLADHHPQRHNARITYIWAIEEPESYLHPSRQKAMAKILREFAKEVQTIVSTHSPHFVPREHDSNIFVVDKNIKEPYNTEIKSNNFEMARQLLGVSLLDSMYLYDVNIVVEGPSDEIILRKAWEILYRNGNVRLDPINIRFFPGGSANGATTLFESLIRFGDSNEVDIFLIIDGDNAGRKALNGLLKRLKRDDIVISANKHYYQLEKDIEWLTSDRVIDFLRNDRPSQVHVIENTKGLITDFKIQSGHKTKVASIIIERSELADLKEHKKLIKKIEKQVEI